MRGEMKKIITYLILISFLLQIGCSSITQIPYPVDESKSESEVRQLNYFGERLTSTIQLTNSCEIEAYWLQMRNDKIYFLTEGLVDTTSIMIDQIQTVRFYDAYGGCMKGGWLGLGLTLLGSLFMVEFTSKSHRKDAGYGIVILAPIVSLLSIMYGLFFLGEREFNFVQSISAKE